jgi:hypothetical protein
MFSGQGASYSSRLTAFQSYTAVGVIGMDDRFVSGAVGNLNCKVFLDATLNCSVIIEYATNKFKRIA